jgi:hypothetical protein
MAERSYQADVSVNNTINFLRNAQAFVYPNVLQLLNTFLTSLNEIELAVT